VKERAASYHKSTCDKFIRTSSIGNAGIVRLAFLFPVALSS